MQRLRRSFYWYGMHQDAIQYVSTCNVCKKVKKQSRKSKASLVNFAPSYVNERLHIDIYGPLSTSKEGNKYILTMADGFSRFV